MQRVIPIESRYFYRHEDAAVPPQWPVVFGNGNPLALEIGCGIGDFVVKTAADHPEWNFIAVDFYNKGCFKTCRRVEKHELTNVRVLREEARKVISEWIPKASLQAVFINCPDPWPKQRHRKRRLVNAEFVTFLHDYLMPGGDFYFATDFDDYGTSVAEMMTGVAGYENMLAPDTYRHDIFGYHRTKYMLKFMAEGKQIYFVHYRKTAKE